MESIAKGLPMHPFGRLGVLKSRRKEKRAIALRGEVAGDARLNRTSGIAYPLDATTALRSGGAGPLASVYICTHTVLKDFRGAKPASESFENYSTYSSRDF